MNCNHNIFKQVWKLFLTGMRYGMKKTWTTATVLTVLYLTYWAITLLTGATACAEDRIPVLYIAALFFAFCTPAEVYGFVNHRQDGILYAGLPVRTWVKFTAMLLVATVTLPLAFYIGIHLTDLLLTAVGGGSGFSSIVWNRDNGMTAGIFFSDFCKICLYQSVFILGNLVLKRHKTAITFLAMLMIHGFCMGVLHIDSLSGPIPEIIYSYVIPVLVWTLSFISLKRIQYR